jgi:hypothetical protein
MSKPALVAASIALAITASAAFAKSQARVGACPSISILGDATRLAVMKAGEVDFAAEIKKPTLDCRVSGATAKSSLSFWVKSAIAPEGEVAERSVPYFVAVISNGQVIDKKVFDLKLPFANGERKVLVKESVARIDIPIANGKTAEDYSVTIGFQLTPEQAAYNRTTRS